MDAETLQGYEKMRGGLPVTFWRDEALEQAARIADRYQADPWIARDIRAMKSAAAKAEPAEAGCAACGTGDSASSIIDTPQPWTLEHLKAYPKAALDILNKRGRQD
jgi:hypothetical protein